MWYSTGAALSDVFAEEDQNAHTQKKPPRGKWMVKI